MSKNRSARNESIADRLARVQSSTRVRVFFMRDGVAQALSGTLTMVAGSEGRFLSLAGEAVTIPLKAITSFTIPAETDAKDQRERRRSLVARWLIRLMIGLAVVWVVRYGYRESDAPVFTVLIVLLGSLPPGLLVGWLVAKGERPDQLSAADAIRADLIEDPSQFGAEQAELLSRIRRTHIKWMAVKFAFGTACFFFAASQAGSSDKTSIEDVIVVSLLVTAGAYIGTIWARGWMQIGNYRG